MPSQEALSDGSLKVGLPGVSNDDLPIREVNKVLALPWFSKVPQVWVIQEVWLARRSISIHSGRTIPWETIWKANIWSKYGSFGVPETQHTNLALSFAELCDSQQRDVTTVKPVRTSRQDKLLALGIQGLDLRASDSKDHIYGLYGLLRVAPSAEDRWDQLIHPDYHKSASELLIDFTVWVILGTKSLPILSAIQVVRGRTWQNLDCIGPEKLQAHGKPPSNHPSWAMWYSGIRKWENKSMGRFRRYQVTGGSETDVSLIAWQGSGRGKPRLQGHRLAQIQSIGPYQLHRQRLGSEMFNHGQYTLKALYPLCHLKIIGLDMVSMMCSTHPELVESIVPQVFFELKYEVGK